MLILFVEVALFCTKICSDDVAFEFEFVYLKEFSEELIARLVKTLKIADTVAMALMSLASIATVKTNELLPHDDAIIASMNNTPNMSYQGIQVLLHLSSFGKVSKFCTSFTCRYQTYLSSSIHALFCLTAAQR